MTSAIKLKSPFRDIDDWLFDRFDRNHILFVLTSGAGFASQASAIHELVKKTGLKVSTEMLDVACLHASWCRKFTLKKLVGKRMDGCKFGSKSSF